MCRVQGSGLRVLRKEDLLQLQEHVERNLGFGSWALSGGGPEGFSALGFMLFGVSGFRGQDS